MSKLRQSMLASPPAAVLLALAMAALTAPVLMLSRVHAAPATPACTVANANGCTELSPIPPEDTAAVPPNIVLMLDDSGSMNWDYMPDWSYLSDNTNTRANNNSANTPNGPRNVLVNSLYYDPAVTYVPPPKADGTSYPNSPGMKNAYFDGFTYPTGGSKNVAAYTASYTGILTGNTFAYYTTLTTANASTVTAPPTGWVCPGGYQAPGPITSTTVCTIITPPPPPPPPYTPVLAWTCNSGDGSPDMGYSPPRCTHVDRSGEVPVTTYYNATQKPTCPSGGSLSGGMCVTAPTPTTANAQPVCPSGYSWNGSLKLCTKTTPAVQFNAFTYVTGTKGNYTQHYVALSTNSCSAVLNSAQADACVSETDTSGVAAPKGVPAGQNIANWFSYYRTRMLMTKSGMMLAFSTVKPTFRFGFASINANGAANIPGTPTPYAFDDSMASGSGGSASNKLAAVQPFGDGSAGTQKAKFWTWLAGEAPGGETPLRKSLDAVGQYYQTSQPWNNMPGDPGYTAGTSPYACRASYTILTTDGFWDGDPATTAGLTGAANVNGPTNSVPAGDTTTQYIAQAPFSGGAADIGPSLADIATYYWATDLQPTMQNIVSTTPSDPAAWQHMTTYTIGLGFTPQGITPAGTTIPQLFAWAHALDGGGSPTPIAGFAWPTPSQTNSLTNKPTGSVYNISDLAHAAINGHGDFFNVTKPADLAAALDKTIGDIGARTVPPTPAAVNASVLSLGAVSFNTGYSTADWSGFFQAVTLNADGSIGDIVWKAGVNLDSDFHSAGGFPSRNVSTGAYSAAGTFSAFKFAASNAASLDATEQAGLGGDPTCPTGSTDTLCNRINYLLGDPTNEGTLYRARTSILGAIIRSQPVYVAGATGNYYSTWPTMIGGVAVTAPENATGAQPYDQFVTAASTRAGMVYVGANDGMLHAFNAPVPQCTVAPDPTTGNCPSGDYAFAGGTSPGHEAWAYVPRAVYANLGNLTNVSDFSFLPTVDATPATRDVFFSQGTRSPNDQWHTILAGGVGLGGRGVYALDVTDPAALSASSVLWEFDSDMTNLATGCVSIAGTAPGGTCRASDLGYTLSKPNIGRLASGKWVVLVPNGYFPDCTTPDIPTATTAACQAVAAQAPKDSSGNPYSALFVMDAETGKMLAELKTPTGISGVTSFGLASPVLGDYNGDRVDDVAFAGDVMGNLWRFDLSDPNPSKWTVTLIYQGGTAKDPVTGATLVQPITSMPRLFPDPTTNRFMVVFGTGRFLGIGDNSDNTVQSVYGVRDVLGTTYTQANLTRQYLHEEVAPELLADGTPNPLAGASLRCVTGGASDTCDTPTAVNAVPASTGGWYVNLYTTTSDGTRNDAGERVVVTAAAIFSSNTAVIGTLITGAQNTDACNPSTQGSILALNALSGGSSGMSSLGGGPYAGARITNAQTSGAVPIVSRLGGARWYAPGGLLNLGGTTAGPGVSGDQPAWRRRSWQELNQNQ